MLHYRRIYLMQESLAVFWAIACPEIDLAQPVTDLSLGMWRQKRCRRLANLRLFLLGVLTCPLSSS